MLALIVLTVVVVIWALVEIVQADPAQVRRLPKWAWVILLFPLAPLGAIAWFLLGRPQAHATVPAGRPVPRLPRRQRYVARPAPDDDVEFMTRLAQEAENRKLFRRLEDDLDGEG